MYGEQTTLTIIPPMQLPLTRRISPECSKQLAPPASRCCSSTLGAAGAQTTAAAPATRQEAADVGTAGSVLVVFGSGEGTLRGGGDRTVR